jgi:hypothetical protein
MFEAPPRLSSPLPTRTVNPAMHSVTTSPTYCGAHPGGADQTTWERMTKLADDFLPKPQILHARPHA